MGDYRIRPHALDDLEEIAEYIFQDNPARSVTFIDEMISRFEAIAERPQSFPVVADLPGGVRSALHRRYRILFEVVEGVPPHPAGAPRRARHFRHSA